VIEGEPLLELLRELKTRDYRFAAVTPETHARVLARPLRSAPTLRDIFGWNRHFDDDQIDRKILEMLRSSGAIQEADGRLRSWVRVASLGGELFLHSPFPTTSPDSVFFGPDTQRFVRFVSDEIRSLESPRWMVDMGSGSGAGGILAAKAAGSPRLTLVDVNPLAADFASINCRSADVQADVVVGNDVPHGCEVVIANPPYMIDGAHRLYRDGGGLYGGELAFDWARRSLAALAEGGTLLLYTGAAVIDGKAPLLEKIRGLTEAAEARLQATEIDPDVFGEELGRPEYGNVERIAVYGIKITKRTAP